jgi:hypothetical protein
MRNLLALATVSRWVVPNYAIFASIVARPLTLAGPAGSREKFTMPRFAEPEEINTSFPGLHEAVVNADCTSKAVQQHASLLEISQN